MLGVFTPDLSDDGGVGWGDLEAFEGVGAAFVGSVARYIGKFCEK